VGRLRRASATARTREGGLERYAEDEASFEAAETVERSSNSAEALLAKFNRLARGTDQVPGDLAEVCGFEGTMFLVRDREGREHAVQMRKVLKKMLSGVKTPLVVGDAVRVEGFGGDEAVIVAIAERRNQLARADSHNKALMHVFAANLDRLVIVAALAMPELKTGLIDRYLTIAHYNDIEPVVVLNKADLADAEDAEELYTGLGYSVFVTRADAAGGDIQELRQHLAGLHCVFCGQSGVGKSSLVNALFPSLAARVGDVSTVQRKGRHTTNASRSYRLEDGTCLIDTPGIRECGITGMTPLDVALFYPDIARFHPHCRFHNCSHVHEPDCAVIAAMEAGTIDPRRYLSYLSIISEDLAGESGRPT
jgi:ribosome biogenesis GTPase